MSAGSTGTSDFHQWRSRWEQHLRSERGLSPNSVERYLSNWDRVYAILVPRLNIATAQTQRMHVATTINVPPALVRDAIAKLHRQGLNGKSIAQVLASLRSFFQFLEREGAIDQNPAKAIRAPKSARKLPAVLDPEAINTLLELPEDAELSVRDRAMMELFYSSGLRLSELVQLNWDHLDLAEAQARVLGKGNKTRIVPIGRFALEALQNLKDQSPSGAEQAVFISQRGTRISVRAVQLRLKTLAKKQGVWQRVHPHLFRHSSASHLLESSGDLRSVQEFLGHADIRTTQVYTHLNFQHLAQVYDSAHPRARRQKTARKSPNPEDSDPNAR